MGVLLFYCHKQVMNISSWKTQSQAYRLYNMEAIQEIAGLIFLEPQHWNAT